MLFCATIKQASKHSVAMRFCLTYMVGTSLALKGILCCMGNCVTLKCLFLLLHWLPYSVKDEE